LRRLHAGRLVILTFHRVRPDGEGAVDRPMRNLEVEAADFRRMLERMRERYEPIALGDWIRRGLAPARASFAVTFDDGWADNADHALPILRELEIPATVFLATGAVEERLPFWWQGAGLPDAEIERRKQTGPAERDGTVPPGGEASHDFLTWGQIREMGASGLVTFGPHGHRHELLDQMSRDEALADIRQSWSLLQERIPEWTVPVLAWPNGNARDDVGDDLEEHGLAGGAGDPARGRGLARRGPLESAAQQCGPAVGGYAVAAALAAATGEVGGAGESTEVRGGEARAEQRPGRRPGLQGAEQPLTGCPGPISIEMATQPIFLERMESTDHLPAPLSMKNRAGKK
jgi:peptidoglycan/xylan/chitin deacetylase (PgdA/CDA1 family)